jgi:hypothetical protein
VGTGVHLRPADGLFAEFLKAYGVKEPPVGSEIILDGKGKPLDWWTRDGGRERRGNSTLTKWSCGCQNVRVGTREFYACCTRCGHAFIKVETPSRVAMPEGQPPAGVANVGLPEGRRQAMPEEGRRP